ncbi:MAG: hypothetical protein CM15mV50_160 [uncultured marine virus]|nr:MAG: hypothetical protein CM15mV50_160 [uncultured marine virus]
MNHSTENFKKNYFHLLNIPKFQNIIENKEQKLEELKEDAFWKEVDLEPLLRIFPTEVCLSGFTKGSKGKKFKSKGRAEGLPFCRKHKTLKKLDL